MSEPHARCLFCDAVARQVHMLLGRRVQVRFEDAGLDAVVTYHPVELEAAFEDLTHGYSIQLAFANAFFIESGQPQVDRHAQVSVFMQQDSGWGLVHQHVVGQRGDVILRATPDQLHEAWRFFASQFPRLQEEVEHLADPPLDAPSVSSSVDRTVVLRDPTSEPLVETQVHIPASPSLPSTAPMPVRPSFLPGSPEEVLRELERLTHEASTGLLRCWKLAAPDDAARRQRADVIELNEAVALKAAIAWARAGAAGWDAYFRVVQASMGEHTAGTVLHDQPREEYERLAILKGERRMFDRVQARLADASAEIAMPQPSDEWLL